ncbi:MAG: redox-sensing transcriptional repressor Rex [Ruminococcaceae bacterium]|nr:redox-sensing transcriptional repressor Rex [Oscillospiraceae bacterium]
MEKKGISKAVLKRLPCYLNYLRGIPDTASPYISATSLANALGMGEVQVRKDLASVSNGGRPKVGYERERLILDIERFLGYDNTNHAVLVGAGKLGLALLGYGGFASYGLDILAAFDIKPSVDRAESGQPVLPMDQLKTFCRRHKICMGILTVPANQAQQACERLIESGIRAIWNFAPVHLEVPDHILVQNENMATSLAVLSMHLQAQMKDEG